MSIVWRDKVLSSYNGNIESVVVHNGLDAQVEVPNGVFVTLGALMADMGREVKKATLATDGTADVLLVSSPEVLYESGKELDDFVNESGKVARAFRLADGDVITLTEDLVDGTPAVGDDYIVGADGKLVPALAVTGSVVTFKVRENARHELTRKQNAWRFDVIK